MNATTLIPVFTGTLQDQPVQLCNARIETYGFICGEDFATAEILSSPELASSKARRQRMTDYHLTLDTAKELSMVENNEQGRMARRYFIAQEKKELARLGQAQSPAELPALPNHHHITPAQAEEIATLMCALFPASLDRHAAWVRFKGNFKIHSYRRLPVSKFDEAITFIESTDARRRNEFGREAQMGSSLAPRNIGPQIDLDALSRQVAEYLMVGQQGEARGIGQETLAEIEALLSETMEQFNLLPNNLIYQNLHAVMSLVKKGKSKGNHRTETRYLEAPQLKSTAQLNLVQLMRESPLVCVEIGLYEIEAAAGRGAEQIHASEIAEVTAQALRNRPEHLAEIQMVSGWMFAEAHSTDAGRDIVRQHWLGVAQSVEGALSS